MARHDDAALTAAERRKRPAAALAIEAGVRERRHERAAKEIARGALGYLEQDDPGCMVTAIEAVFSPEVVARASVKLRAIRILLDTYSEATGGMIPCACCGHVLARHPSLRLDAETGDGEWNPGICAGETPAGCAAKCKLFEVPEDVATPPDFIRLPRVTP